MAIFPYREREVAPEAARALSEINQYSLSAKAMLTALGDYWTNYYRNLEPIAAAATGAVAALSKEYTRILDMVRSANILDIPLRQSDQFQLLVVRLADVRKITGTSGAVDHFFIPVANITDIRYLTSSLFESRVVLEKSVHFDVVQGQGIKLYVDLFNDRGITGYTYEIGEDSDQGILLWACDIAFTSSVIFERYGRFLYRKAQDGEQYKWLVSALMRFYESAKTVESIQNVLNIMYGVPYTRYKDEVVKDVYYVDKDLNRTLSQIEDPYICIETDRACYYTYAFSEVIYKPGDTVPQFSLLANFNIVEDYIKKPGWWKDVAFPDNLVSGAASLSAERQNELMDKVLKYNTVHIRLGVSFETYATYLAQVKQFFAIIESGFPVYLYPLVDTFFRAVFLDKWEISDELFKVRAALGLESAYPWGSNLKFNGEANYYMEPDLTHGKDLKCDPRLFDGNHVYAPPGKHHCKDKGILAFDGPKYDAKWKYDHGNDREELSITGVSCRQSENWPWAESVVKRELSYSGEAISDGSKAFGEMVVKTGNEEFLLSLTRTYADQLPLPDESFLLGRVAAKPFVNNFPTTVFAGEISYSGEVSADEKTYDELLQNKITSYAYDGYPWENAAATRLVPITYCGVGVADGSVRFGEERKVRDSEPFCMSICSEFSDHVSAKEGAQNFRLLSVHTDTFAGRLFDGSHTYGKLIVPALAGYSEDFQFTVLRR